MQELIVKSNVIWQNQDISYLKCVPINTKLKKKILPGMFFNISIEGKLSPFLRRPISIAYKDNEAVYFLIKSIGEGTDAIVKASVLSLLGPLGNNFPRPNSGDLLIAGGVGIAPLHFLKRFYGAGRLIWGLREKSAQAQYPEDIINIADKVYIDANAPIYENIDEELDRDALHNVFVCANKALTELVIKKANQRNLKVYASLESHMGCGWGACNGCFVNIAGRSGYVCKEGPVFEF